MIINEGHDMSRWHKAWDSSDEISQEIQATVTNDEIDDLLVAPKDTVGQTYVMTTPFSNGELLTFDGENRINEVRFYLNTLEPLRIKFDGKLKNFKVFMFNVMDRVTYANWHDITNINGYYHKIECLITKFNSIHLSHVKENALEYQQHINRRTQNAEAMYYFLMDSLENKYKSKIIQHQTSFTINGRKNGPLLYMKITTLLENDSPPNIPQLFEQTQKQKDENKRVKQRRKRNRKQQIKKQKINNGNKIKYNGHEVQQPNTSTMTDDEHYYWDTWRRTKNNCHKSPF
jgi:hypothetical protein